MADDDLETNPTTDQDNAQAEDPSPSDEQSAGIDDLPSEAMDQSAIDAMLGSAFSSSSKREESGIEQIVRAGFVAYERMPMLENVFDRLIRFLATRLRGYTNDNIDITIENMQSLRFGDFMATVPSSSSFAIFHAKEWKNYGLFVIDAALAYSIINIFMGGECSFDTRHVENRPLTALERELIKNLVTTTLSELERAFTPIGQVELVYDRLEISSSLASIVRPSNAAVTVRFHIDLGDSSGNMDLVIPFATLEPVRDKLSQQFMGDSSANDSIWEHHLLSEIIETHVKVSAIFQPMELPLKEILRLQKGSVLHIPCDPEAPHRVQVECDGMAICEATLGKVGNKYAASVDKRLLPPGEELTSELLASLVGEGAEPPQPPN